MPDKKPTMDKGFKVSIEEAAELASHARGGGERRTGDTYAERIGKTFLDKLMERVADGVFGNGTTNNGDTLDSLSRTFDIVGKAREAFGIKQDDKEDRPRRRDRDEELFITATLRMMENMVDKFTDAIKDNNSRLEKLMERLSSDGRDSKDGKSSKFEELAWTLLQQQLQRNPVAEISGAVEVVKSLRESLGVGVDEDKDIDMFLAKERMRIEEKRVDAEIENMRESREMRSSFVAALPQILGHRRKTTEEAPLFRYTCDACHHEWLSAQRPRPGDTITCPSCSRTLEIGEGEKTA